MDRRKDHKGDPQPMRDGRMSRREKIRKADAGKQHKVTKKCVRNVPKRSLISSTSIDPNTFSSVALRKSEVSAATELRRLATTQGFWSEHHSRGTLSFNRSNLSRRVLFQNLKKKKNLKTITDKHSTQHDNKPSTSNVDIKKTVKSNQNNNKDLKDASLKALKSLSELKRLQTTEGFWSPSYTSLVAPASDPSQKDKNESSNKSSSLSSTNSNTKLKRLKTTKGFGAEVPSPPVQHPPQDDKLSSLTSSLDRVTRKSVGKLDVSESDKISQNYDDKRSPTAKILLNNSNLRRKSKALLPGLSKVNFKKGKPLSLQSESREEKNEQRNLRNKNKELTEVTKDHDAPVKYSAVTRPLKKEHEPSIVSPKESEQNLKSKERSPRFQRQRKEPINKPQEEVQQHKSQREEFSVQKEIDLKTQRSAKKNIDNVHSSVTEKLTEGDLAPGTRDSEMEVAPPVSVVKRNQEKLHKIPVSVRKLKGSNSPISFHLSNFNMLGRKRRTGKQSDSPQSPPSAKRLRFNTKSVLRSAECKPIAKSSSECVVKQVPLSSFASDSHIENKCKPDSSKQPIKSSTTSQKLKDVHNDNLLTPVKRTVPKHELEISDLVKSTELKRLETTNGFWSSPEMSGILHSSPHKLRQKKRMRSPPKSPNQHKSVLFQHCKKKLKSLKKAVVKSQTLLQKEDRSLDSPALTQDDVVALKKKFVLKQNRSREMIKLGRSQYRSATQNFTDGSRLASVKKHIHTGKRQKNASEKEKSKNVVTRASMRKKLEKKSVSVENDKSSKVLNDAGPVETHLVGNIFDIMSMSSKLNIIPSSEKSLDKSMYDSTDKQIPALSDIKDGEKIEVMDFIHSPDFGCKESTLVKGVDEKNLSSIETKEDCKKKESIDDRSDVAEDLEKPACFESTVYDESGVKDLEISEKSKSCSRHRDTNLKVSEEVNVVDKDIRTTVEISDAAEQTSENVKQNQSIVLVTTHHMQGTKDEAETLLDMEESCESEQKGSKISVATVSSDKLNFPPFDENEKKDDESGKDNEIAIRMEDGTSSLENQKGTSSILEVDHAIEVEAQNEVEDVFPISSDTTTNSSANSDLCENSDKTKQSQNLDSHPCDGLENKVKRNEEEKDNVGDPSNVGLSHSEEILQKDEQCAVLNETKPNSGEKGSCVSKLLVSDGEEMVSKSVPEKSDKSFLMCADSDVDGKNTKEITSVDDKQTDDGGMCADISNSDSAIPSQNILLVSDIAEKQDKNQNCNKRAESVTRECLSEKFEVVENDFEIKGVSEKIVSSEEHDNEIPLSMSKHIVQSTECKTKKSISQVKNLRGLPELVPSNCPKDPLRKVRKRKRVNRWKRGVVKRYDFSKLKKPKPKVSADSNSPQSTTMVNNEDHCKRQGYQICRGKNKRGQQMLKRLTTEANFGSAPLTDELQTRTKSRPLLCQDMIDGLPKISSKGRRGHVRGRGIGIKRLNADLTSGYLSIKISEKSAQNVSSLPLPELKPLDFTAPATGSLDGPPPVLTPQFPLSFEASVKSFVDDIIEDEVVKEFVDESNFQLYWSDEDKSPVKIGSPVRENLSQLEHQASTSTVTQKQPKKLKGKRGKPPGIKATKKSPKTARKTVSPRDNLYQPKITELVRTFEFRKKTTRSPLEMLEMKRRQEEAMYDMQEQKRQARLIILREKRNARQSPGAVIDEPLSSEGEEDFEIKPCFVVLNDFVKKLRLDGMFVPGFEESEMNSSPISMDYEDDKNDEDWYADLEDIEEENEDIGDLDSKKRPQIPRLKLKRVVRNQNMTDLKSRNLVSQLKSPDQGPLKMVIKTEPPEESQELFSKEQIDQSAKIKQVELPEVAQATVMNQKEQLENTSAQSTGNLPINQIDLTEVERTGFVGSYLDFLKERPPDGVTYKPRKFKVQKSAPDVCLKESKISESQTSICSPNMQSAAAAKTSDSANIKNVASSPVDVAHFESENIPEIESETVIIPHQSSLEQTNIKIVSEETIPSKQPVVSSTVIDKAMIYPSTELNKNQNNSEISVNTPVVGDIVIKPTVVSSLTDVDITNENSICNESEQSGLPIKTLNNETVTTLRCAEDETSPKVHSKGSLADPSSESEAISAEVSKQNVTVLAKDRGESAVLFTQDETLSTATEIRMSSVTDILPEKHSEGEQALNAELDKQKNKTATSDESLSTVSKVQNEITIAAICSEVEMAPTVPLILPEKHAKNEETLNAELQQNITVLTDEERLSSAPMVQNETLFATATCSELKVASSVPSILPEKLSDFEPEDNEALNLEICENNEKVSHDNERVLSAAQIIHQETMLEATCSEHEIESFAPSILPEKHFDIGPKGEEAEVCKNDKISQDNDRVMSVVPVSHSNAMSVSSILPEKHSDIESRGEEALNAELSKNNEKVLANKERILSTVQIIQSDPTSAATCTEFDTTPTASSVLPEKHSDVGPEGEDSSNAELCRNDEKVSSDDERKLPAVPVQQTQTMVASACLELESASNAPSSLSEKYSDDESRTEEPLNANESVVPVNSEPQKESQQVSESITSVPTAPICKTTEGIQKQNSNAIISHSNNNNEDKSSPSSDKALSNSPVHSTSNNPVVEKNPSSKLKVILPQDRLPSSFRYTCKRCGFTTLTKLTIESHIYSHIPGVQFRCASCQSEFSSMAAAATHLKNTHQLNHQKLLITGYLDEVNFYDKADNPIALVEQDNHTLPTVSPQVPPSTGGQSPPFIISVVVNSGSGNRAVRTGSANRRYVCSHCGFSTNVKEDIEQHVSDLHSAQGLYACTLCDQSIYSSEDDIGQHCASVHPSRPKPYRKIPDFYDADHLAKMTQQKRSQEEHGSPTAANIYRVSSVLDVGDVDSSSPVDHKLKAKEYLDLQDDWKGKESVEADSTTDADYSEETSTCSYKEDAVTESTPDVMTDNSQDTTHTSLTQESVVEREASQENQMPLPSNSEELMEVDDYIPPLPEDSNEHVAEADQEDGTLNVKITEVVSLSEHIKILNNVQNNGDAKASSSTIDDIVDDNTDAAFTSPVSVNSFVETAVSVINSDSALISDRSSKVKTPAQQPVTATDTIVDNSLSTAVGSSAASSLTQKTLQDQPLSPSPVEIVSTANSTTSQGVQSAEEIQKYASSSSSSATTTSECEISPAQLSGHKEPLPLSSQPQTTLPETSSSSLSSSSSGLTLTSTPVSSPSPSPSTPSSSLSSSLNSGGLPLSYKCKACKVHTPYLLMMVKHLKSRHSNIRCFSCPYCKSSSSFISQKQLRHHVRSQHPSKVDKNEISLSREANKLVEAMVLPYSDQCTRVGNRLVLEEDIHTCTLCSLRMTSMPNVYDHLKEKHSDLFEFICPVCQAYKSKSLQDISNHCISQHESNLDKDKFHVSVPKYLFVVLKCISSNGKYIEKALAPVTSSETSSSSASKPATNSSSTAPSKSTTTVSSSLPSAAGIVSAAAITTTANDLHSPQTSSVPEQSGNNNNDITPQSRNVQINRTGGLNLASSIQTQLALAVPTPTGTIISPLVALPINPSGTAAGSTPTQIPINSSLFDTSSLVQVAMAPKPTSSSSYTGNINIINQSSSATSQTAKLTSKPSNSKPNKNSGNLPVLNVPSVKQRSDSLSPYHFLQSQVVAAATAPASSSSSSSLSSPQQATMSQYNVLTSQPSSTDPDIEQLPENEPNPDAFKIFNLRPSVSSAMAPKISPPSAQAMTSSTPSVFPPVSSSSLALGFLPGPIAGFPAAMVIPPNLVHNAFPFAATNIRPMNNSGSSGNSSDSASNTGSNTMNTRVYRPIGVNPSPQQPSSSGFDTLVQGIPAPVSALLPKGSKKPRQYQQQIEQSSQQKQQQQIAHQTIQPVHQQLLRNMSPSSIAANFMAPQSLARAGVAAKAPPPPNVVPMEHLQYNQRLQNAWQFQMRSPFPQLPQELTSQSQASSPGAPGLVATGQGSLSAVSGQSYQAKKGKRSSQLYQCPYCPHLVELRALDVASHIHQVHPGKQVTFQKIPG